MEKKLVGKITHWFGKIGVGVIELSAVLNVGDRVSIESASGIIEQSVESMQVNKQAIKTANAGQSVGMKINGETREGALVYKLF